MASTSVKKAKSRVPYIPGTKPSIKNAQLLISTGIPSMDNLIGGGLPIGSIFLVEEDTYGIYSRITQKYFIAEGVVSSHPLTVASQDTKPSEIISELPALTESDTRVGVKEDPTAESMKIAWRYENMKIVDSSPSGQNVFGHFYDLTRNMEKELVEKARIGLWDGDKIRWESEAFVNKSYVDLLKTIEGTIKDQEFLVSDTPEQRNVLRISIHSLGSRLWLCDEEKDTHSDLLRFLYCLRALLRNSYAVAMITIPTHNFDNSDAIVERIEHLSDIAIRLESFAGSSKETNPIFKDYHGLVHVKKIAAFNTLATHSLESTDLAFKLRRKKFLIEILHLPPEFGETTQREQDDVGFTNSCSGTSTRSPLDF